MPSTLRVHCLLFFLTLSAGEAICAAKSPHGAKEEDAIRAQEERERTAIFTQNASALEGIWSDAYAVNNPLGTITPTRQDVLNRVSKGLIHFASYRREIELLRIDHEMAIVMGKEFLEASGGTPLPHGHLELRFTHVWRKEGRTWRVFARHANIISPKK